MKQTGNLKSIPIMLMVFLGTLTLLSACGKKPVSETDSPQLIGGELQSYNEGEEDSQFVKVNLVFDRDISVADNMDSLRVTISKERMEGELQMGDSADTASLILPVEAVTSGVLEIGKAEKADTMDAVMDKSGSYAAKDFALEGMIPSGVTLSTVESENGKVTKQVDSAWSIRSIAWIALSQNGEQAPVSEQQQGEELNGYAAVHGHEFLQEDEKDIAEKIMETLENNYGEEYRFSCDGSNVTAQRIDGESTLDIEIYHYLKIDGKETEPMTGGDDPNGQEDSHEHADTGAGAEGEAESHEESGLKIKVTETTREIAPKEQAILDTLHISQCEDVPEYEGIKDGGELYTTLTITGNAMPEKQIYSVKDLETLIQDSFQNESMYNFDLPMEKEGYYGIHLPAFLRLCGAEQEGKNIRIHFSGRNEEEMECSLEELEEASAMLALSGDNGPLRADEGEIRGPLSLLLFRDGKTESVGNLQLIQAGVEGDFTDPEYELHNREPFTDSKDALFTVEVYQQGAEYLGAVKKAEFTTEDLETLWKENPQAAEGNYYGTLGNMEYYSHMGVGGWLDYFEGINLKWLLTGQLELESMEGYAELVGRDGEVYGTIEDLAYLTEDEEPPSYYTLTSDGIRIPGAVPMIAFSKNGYPLLPEHDHESEGYIAYNHLNQQLEKAGIGTEVGVIKNHSGPFIACLGNRDGLYGGDKVETGGDCVTIRLYLAG